LTQSENISLEERKLALEEKKLELEKERVRLERLNARTTRSSIVISVLIAALTIAFGVWSQYKQAMTQLAIQDKQATSQLELEEKTAKSQFEIKAAEIVMNTDIPGVTRHKAKALLALFPEKLPSNFAASFDPDKYAEKQEAVAATPVKRGRAKREEEGGGGGGGQNRAKSVIGRPIYRRPPRSDRPRP
jgi:hypothetical protein